jgi:hypothetical protein
LLLLLLADAACRSSHWIFLPAREAAREISVRGAASRSSDWIFLLCRLLLGRGDARRSKQ